jgi:P2-related tail formation protein
MPKKSCQIQRSLSATTSSMTLHSPVRSLYNPFHENEQFLPTLVHAVDTFKHYKPYKSLDLLYTTHQKFYSTM